MATGNAETQSLFHDHVRLIWRELEHLPPAAHFGNLEGGSVEQHRDKRLLLHHCANYAAALTLLDGVGPDLRLLELGCGGGALSYAFARVMPSGWHLTATDYAAALVEAADRRFAAPNLAFERLDVRRIEPTRLASVDVVFLLEVIEHLPQGDAADLLRRLHAAMRPGAVLLLSTLDRAPFPRPFSGYAPHFVEYTHRSLSTFLGSPATCPFEHVLVHRITSPRIAAEAVRSENRGGYVLNHLQRRLLALGKRHPALARTRDRLATALYRAYARLPASSAFDLEGYLGTLDLVQHRPEDHDRDSFSLVAELRKA